MARCLLVSILIFLASPNYASNPREDSIKYPFTIGIKPQYGFIIIHSRSIRGIKDSYPIGIEVDFSWHQNAQQQWDNCHCYPRIGFVINYFYYDNPEILGNGIAALYYIEPFFGAYKKLSLSTRAGIGLTYLTNPYDEISNPHNQSYSTHLSSFLALDFGINYRISDEISINASGSYNHTSNGGIKVPNKGLNFPTVGIGVDYTFKPQKFINRDKIKFRDSGSKKQRLDLDMLGILKSYKHGEPLEHIIWGGSANYSYQIGRLSALIGSMELLVNGVVKEELSRKGIEDKSHVRVGVLFGHEFLMGRYQFSTQMGIYAYRPYRDNDYDLLYQRYKLTYHFDNGVYIGIGLKAHRQVADYFDFRMGYSFGKMNN